MRDVRLALAVSVAIYAVSRVFGLSLPNWPEARGVALQPVRLAAHLHDRARFGDRLAERPASRHPRA